jgi:Glycosyltransferase family 87
MAKLARTTAKITIVGALLAFNVFYYVARFPRMKNGIDFPAFYCAARMVLSGDGAQLYNLEAEQRYQAQYTGRVGVIFNHPSFETLLYGVVGWLPYSRAYLAWTVISTGLIAASMFLLNRAAGILDDPGPLMMLPFVYAPVALDLFQGHDVAVLLLVYAVVYSALRRNRFFLAGGVLAIGLFKPHLVLPFLLIFFLARRSWKFLGGFAIVAILLALISIAICGWQTMVGYPSYVLSLRNVRLAGYYPAAMANLRGLLSLVIANSSWRAAVLIAGSIMLVWIAVSSWSRFNEPSRAMFDAVGPPQAASKTAFDLAFSNAIVVTLLVSYHLSPHDATLLLIPIMLGFGYLRQRGLGQDPLRIFLAVLLVGLFLPPLHVLVLGIKTYALVAIPMLLFSGCLMAVTTQAEISAAAQSK